MMDPRKLLVIGFALGLAATTSVSAIGHEIAPSLPVPEPCDLIPLHVDADPCSVWSQHRSMVRDAGDGIDHSHLVDIEASPQGELVYVAEAFEGDVEAGDYDVGLPDTGPWKGLEIRITARDAASGQPLWTSGFDSPVGPSWPVGIEVSPDGERVYTAGPTWADLLAFGSFASHDYVILAFDASDGDLLWKRMADGERDPQQPSVPSDDLPADLAVGPDDRVYVTGLSNAPPAKSGGQLTLAYDGQSGEELWRHRQPGKSGAKEIEASPDGERVYVAGTAPYPQRVGSSLPTTETYALDAESGDRLWQVGLPDDRTGKPVDVTVSAEGVYVFGGVDGEWEVHNTTEFLTRLDPQTGSQAWHASWQLGRAVTENHRPARDVLLVDEQAERVYLARPLPEDAETTVHGYVIGTDLSALDATTGDHVWTANFARPTTDFLYLDTDLVEIQLSPDGEVLYGVGTPWHVPGFRTGAHDAATGEPLWSATHQNASDSDHASALHVGPQGERVYALGVLDDAIQGKRSATVAYDASGLQLVPGVSP